MLTLSKNIHSIDSLRQTTSNRACDICHIKKTKCLKDETGKCLACMKRNSDCTYNTLPAKRGPKPAESISKSTNPNLDTLTFDNLQMTMESESQFLIPISGSESSSDTFSDSSFDAIAFSNAMNTITEGFVFDINLLLSVIPNVSLIPRISDILVGETVDRSLMLDILKETLGYLSSSNFLTNEQGVLVMDFFENHGDPNVPLDKIIMAFAFLPVGSPFSKLLANSICTAYICRIFNQDNLTLLIKYYEEAANLMYQIDDKSMVDPFLKQTFFWSKWLLESVSIILN